MMSNEMKERLKAHIIEASTGRMIAQPLLYFCPRVGEEIRTGEMAYWEVISVIHVLDEIDSPFSRANIGVKAI